LHDFLLKNGLPTHEQVQVHGPHTGPTACSAINRRTASAFSASDNGSEAIINNAAENESPLIGGDFDLLDTDSPPDSPRSFSGSPGQQVVQRESFVAVTPDRLPLGTRCPRNGMQEVIGSTPLSSNDLRRQVFPNAR